MKHDCIFETFLKQVFNFPNFGNLFLFLGIVLIVCFYLIYVDLFVFVFPILGIYLIRV